MSPSRPILIAITIGLTLAVSGCAKQGPFAQRQNNLTALKSSVGLLENQNGQLKTKVAELSQDNRRLEDRLVQEEASNGDLAARLDDARNVMAQRTQSRNSFSADDEPITKPVRRPAPKSARRPPAARIPSSNEESASFETDPIELPKPRTRTDGAQSYRDDSSWLPIAQGTSEPKYRLK